MFSFVVVEERDDVQKVWLAFGFLASTRILNSLTMTGSWPTDHS